MSFIPKSIVSFGIGLSIYCSLGFIFNYFSRFQIIYAYLSLIIFDLIFFISLLIIKRKKIFRVFKANKDNLKAYLLKNKFYISISIIIIVLYLAIPLYWNIISESIGLIRRDPYLWIEEIYYLLNDGAVKNINVEFTYSSGYLFIISGFLLPVKNEILIYFFLKISSIYFMILYLMASFFILKKIFKKNYLILLSLVMLLLSDYFISRNIINIPSSLASLIFLISLMCIVYEYPDYLIGFFLAFLYLLHLLTFFLYVFVILVYFTYKIMINLKAKRNLLNSFKNIFGIILIFIALILPFLLTYFESIEKILNWYRSIIFNPDNLKSIQLFFPENGQKILYIFPLDFFVYFLQEELLVRLHNIAKFANNSYFFLSFIGLAIKSNFKKMEKSKRSMIIMLKFSFILVLVFSLSPFFSSNLYFLDVFKYRTLETFALPIIILSVFTIEKILMITRKYTNNAVYKLRSFRQFLRKNKKISKYLNFRSILFIIFIINIYSVLVSSKPPYYYYTYEDSYLDMVLYLRENANKSSVIYHPHMNKTEIENVLYDMENHFYNITDIFRTARGDKLIFKDIYFNYLIAEKSNFPKEWRYSYSPNFKFEVVRNNTNYILYYKKYLS